MKGKIDITGTLRIVRGNLDRSQICPFDVEPNPQKGGCGDWCPLFGEPETILPNDSTHADDLVRVHLQLCHKTLIFLVADFEDQRK